MVCKYIQFFCQSLIVPEQHGFCPKKSTTTNLLEFTNQLNINMQNGLQTDVFYADLSKAFDRVDHSILLLKLERYGFPEWILAWIQSYLKQRTQYVNFKNRLSKIINVLSGVPQGSHIGPILFLLFINDIGTNILYSKILIFADDFKLFYGYTNPSGYLFLQHDIDKVFEWCTSNGMDLNKNKCKVLSYSRKRELFLSSYFIDESLVDRIYSFNDLGVLFDVKLSFNSHIDVITSKARSRLGLIKRFSKEFNDPHISKLLYCALVRPILEYCSCVWCPSYEVSIAKIESVQKQFLLFVLRHLPWDPTQHLPPYENRLNLISLTTLKKRREVNNVIFLFQLLSGSICSAHILSMLNINSRPRFTRNPAFFYTSSARVNYGLNEALNVMCIDFNRLYHLIDFNLSKNSLKQKLLNC